MSEYIVQAAEWAIDINGNSLYQGCEEIVRCGNCKYCYKERRDTLNGWVDVLVCGSPQWSTASLMPSHEVEPDGFCKWGEQDGDAE